MLQRTVSLVLLIVLALAGSSGAARSQVPATLTPVSGSGQSTAVDTLFSNPLKVIVQDSGGNTLPNIAVTFTSPAGSASTASTVLFGGASNSTTVMTDALGAAIVPAAQLKASQIAGQYDITASAGSASNTILLINSAGPPASIVIAQGAGQSATVGTALPINFSAKVVDGFGNPVSGLGVTFTAPGSGASGTFSGSLTAPAITDLNGLASAPQFTLNSTAGVFNVTANLTSSPFPTAANFNLISTPSAPTQISISQGNSQSTQVTTSYATALRVLVRDASSNPVPNVTVTFTAPGSGASATFASSGSATETVTTDASGLATASTLTANTIAGSFSVTATFSGGPTATFSLTNTPGPAATIAINAGDAQATTITLAFATNLSVIVKDTNGNAVSGATVSFAAPGAGASGTFGGALTKTATTNASGIATATTFTANAIAGTYTIVVTYGSLTVSFTLTNNNPSQIIVNAGSNQSTTVTLAFGTALSAKVTDSGGTGIAGLTVTFTAPSSGASGTFSGGGTTVTATTNASGIATATTFTANATPGTFMVSATVTGVAAPANFTLINNPPAAIVAQTGDSQQATIGTAFPTALSAKVTDSGGNPISGLVVTFTAPGSGASGTFSGGVTTKTATTNASGIASIGTFTANATTGSYQVSVSAPGYAAAPTFSLTNLPQTPVTIAASPSNGTPQSIAINGTFGTALGVIVKDVNGIVLTSYPVTFTVVPAGGAGATFSGGGTTSNVNTNGSGIATAPTLTANGTAGTYTVTATAGSLTFTFTLTNVAPATIAATGGTPQSTAINTNFAQQLQVLVKDASSNPVSGAIVTFTAPGSGASGTMGGSATTTAVTNASGIATVSVTANGTAGSYSVTASASGIVTPASFALTNLAPATVTASAGTPQNGVIGTAYATALQATVTDSGGTPVPGATVTFTVNAVAGAGATFAGSVTTVNATTNSSGIATAPALTANATTGAFTVTASSTGAGSATYSLTNILPNAATAVASPASGTPQSTAVNTAFSIPIGVLVKDAGGTVIVGKTVTFTINTGGGGASAAFPGGVTTVTATTNASGIATAPAVTANGSVGAYTLLATVDALTVSFSLANTAVPATITATAGNNQTATISTSFATALQATVRDAANNPVVGAVVVFSAPGSGATGAFAGSSSTSAVTNSSGIATAPAFTAGTTAGSYAVTATVQGTSLSTTFTLANAPGAPSSIARVSGNAQSAALGATFASPMIAVVRDASANPIPNVTVTFTAPASGKSASFGGSNTVTATTDSSGNATSPAFTAITATGAYSVTAKATGGSAPSTTFTETNTAAVPNSVAVQSGSSQTTVVNTNFGATLQAIVLDTLGNPASGVTVTFSTPSSGASGTFSGSTTATATTNASGIATSPTLKANTTAGTFFAQATVSGVAMPAAYTLTNTPGQPAAISLSSGTPQSTIVNTAYAAPLVAIVKDLYGNPVPGATVNFLAPTAGSVGSFPGSASTASVITDAAGKATSPTVTANGIAGSYTITATLPSVSSVNFNLTNLANPTALTIQGTSTQTTQVSTGFATPLKVLVKDNLGQPISGLTVTFSVPGSGASATLSSTSATTDSSGIATVTATANATSGSYLVTANVASLSTTFSLTNAAGAPGSIAATGGSTQSTAISTAFAQALQVTVRDGSSNPVPNATVTYTVVPASGGAAATLSVATATTDASGNASVVATANTKIGSYTVTAAVSGVGTAATFNLTNTIGAPASIAVSNGSPQTTAVSTAFANSLQVVVKDGAGNPVPGISVSFTPPSSGAAATLSSATAVTDASGVASVNATANTVAGTYSVTASVAGVATPATFGLTNTAGAAAGITASGGNTQSTQVTNAFATPLQVTVRDTSNNPVPNVTVTFAVPGSGASATLSSATATTNASGVASVTATANGVAGSYVVDASVTGIPTPAKFNLTNLVGPPSSIAVSGGSTQSTPVGAGFATPLQVVVRDGSGNGISGLAITYTLQPATNGATATLSSATATTDSTGNASVTATANAVAGSYSVQAKVTGVSGAATFNLTNIGTPGLQLTVSGSPSMVSAPGQTVVFSYSVKNSGTVAVTGLALTDAKVSGISCPVTSLAVGATTVCTASYVVTAADIAGTRGITSVATASGSTSAGPAVSPTVTTPIGIDVSAVRKATADAIKGLMQSRAQALTSMAPSAQRMQHRMTSTIFGDDDPQKSEEPGDRPGPLKAFETPSAPATMPALAGSGLPSGAQQPMSLGRDSRGAANANAASQQPFAFGGQSEDGNGRFNFAGSLSQLRATADADEQAKIAAARAAGAAAGLGGGVPATTGSLAKRDNTFDVWVEGQSSYYTNNRADGRRQGNVGVIYTGVDAIIGPGICVGVMSQYDWISDNQPGLGRTREGAGWMAGPYIGLKLTKNLFFDARYAYGTATNHVDPLGAYVDTFSSTRQLASARLTGDWVHGKWRLRPSIDVTYYSEQQKGYVNQIGIFIPQSRLTLGRATFGPELAYRMTLGDQAVLEPYVAIKGVWDFARDTSTLSSGEAVAPDTLTGRLEAGASYRTPSGITFRASGAYDGLGSDTYHAWQGQAFVVVPLQ